VPTYEYACTDCGDRLEIVQSFSDDPLTVCLACNGKLRKVFSPVGIVFKGSGFYRTDSRNGNVPAGSSPAKSGSDGSSGEASASTDGAGGKSESKSESKSDSASGSPAASSGTSSGNGAAKSGTSSPVSAGSAGSGSKVA
jgi:putative FmdB family regulatory protein